MAIYNGSECDGLCQRKLNPWRQHRCKSLASAQSTRFTCQAHPCHIHSPCHRQKECFDFLYKIPYTTYVAPVHYAYVGRSEGLNELQNHCPPQRAHRREKMAYPRRGKCIHIWGPMHPYPCEDPCIHIHTVPMHPYPYEDPCAHIHMMAHAIWQCPNKGGMRVILGKNQKHAPICSKQNINENMGFHTWVYLAGIGRFRARTETEYQFFSPT